MPFGADCLGQLSSSAVALLKHSIPAEPGVRHLMILRWWFARLAAKILRGDVAISTQFCQKVTAALSGRRMALSEATAPSIDPVLETSATFEASDLAPPE